MPLKKNIEKVRQHFGITKHEDWQAVHPSWILALDGIGPATLDEIRIYLAARNLTLKGDRTPEYWKALGERLRIGVSLADGDVEATCPYTILVDSQEQQPWTFAEIRTDADQGNRPLHVPYRWQSLGVSGGDYSIDGLQGQCSIERKSMDDAHGTILGWGERRERFVRTLDNLSQMAVSAVVVECNFDVLIVNAPAWGSKSARENAIILHRQVLAWQQDYRVPWIFCADRRFAEQTAFRILDRFWQQSVGKKKPRRLERQLELIG